MIRRIVMVFGSALLLISALVPNAAGQVQAQSSPGEVFRLAGVNPGLVYAGMACGVFQREMHQPWTKVAGLDSGPVQDMVSLQGDAVLAVSGNTLYRREPGGGFQVVMEPGNAGSPAVVTGVAANPAGTRAYYVTGGSVAVVYRSDDGGRSWKAAGAPNGGTSESYATDIAVLADRATGQEAALVSYGLPGRQGSGSRLSRSTDGGLTWSDVPGYTGDVAQSTAPLLFVDQNGSTFYAAHFHRPDMAPRLYRGDIGFGGLAEIPLPAELKPNGIRRLVAYNNTMIVAGDVGLLISRALGAPNTWARYDQNLGGRRINDLLYTYRQPIGPFLYVATSSGVFERPDGHPQWDPASENLPSCGTVTPYTSIPPFQDTPERRFFIQTGHSLSGGFKTFWERNGGLPVFGYPLSEEFSETNIDLRQDFTTQYFERERFEYHPENSEPYRVLLGRLGDEVLRLRGRDWRNEGGTSNPFPGTTCEAFAVGSQRRTVCGPFLQYWRTHGLDLDRRPGVTFNESLGLFGLPLTAPKVEQNPDGGQVWTQWFERARFEYHPQNPEPYKVLLGRLGAEVLRPRGVPVP